MQIFVVNICYNTKICHLCTFLNSYKFFVTQNIIKPEVTSLKGANSSPYIVRYVFNYLETSLAQEL